MQKAKVLGVLNILGFSLVLVLNIMANSLPLNGYTTGELSKMYPNLFVPAGFTFAIWGLIYFFLAGFIFFQLIHFFSKERKSPQAVSLIGAWFFISCLANAGWILTWHYRYPVWSLLLMLLLLVSLIQIYRNLGYGIRSVSTAEKWWIQAPFSLYLGWISVATLANTTAVLVHINFSGWGLPEPFWAAALILLSGLLGLFFLRQNFDFVYAAVIIWACFGIYYKRSYLAPAETPVITTSAAAVAILLIYRSARSFSNFKGPRAYC